MTAVCLLSHSVAAALRDIQSGRGRWQVNCSCICTRAVGDCERVWKLRATRAAAARLAPGGHGHWADGTCASLFPPYRWLAARSGP